MAPRPEDTERHAGQRHRHEARPAALLLFQRSSHVRLGDVEDGAENVLGHLHTMRAARRREHMRRRQVLALQPVVDADRHRLHPFQLRHFAEHSRRRVEAEKYLGARQMGRIRLLAGRHGGNIELVTETSLFERSRKGLRITQGQQHQWFVVTYRSSHNLAAELILEMNSNDFLERGFSLETQREGTLSI